MRLSRAKVSVGCRVSANEARRIGKPFFMASSFVNPHDRSAGVRLNQYGHSVLNR
jgi:hypothetical protein